MAYVRVKNHFLKMSNTYHQIYIHIVFAVKFRAAVLDKKWRVDLFNVIGNIINDSKCKPILVNGVEDHVHCLIGLRPSISVSELMKTVKAKSSKYINSSLLTSNRFEWQEGYGVFSVDESKIAEIYKYIKNQEEHHQTQKLTEEYCFMLNKNGIAYDPNYIFQPLI